MSQTDPKYARYTKLTKVVKIQLISIREILYFFVKYPFVDVLTKSTGKPIKAQDVHNTVKQINKGWKVTNSPQGRF